MTERPCEVNLSGRLLHVARHVPAGSRLADIGSDHALLPVYLVQQGKAVSAVAGEINEGPLRAALRQVRHARLEHRISVRLGDGLAIIEPGEVDAVTIAGMGGAAIAGILSRGLERLTGVSRLVLQPNVGAALVRRWLLDHDWLLDGETVVAEDGLYYEILTARPAATERDRAANAALYGDYAACPGLILKRELLLLLGPLLVRSGDGAFTAKWEDELAKRAKILRSMERAESGEGLRKRQLLIEEATTIGEVLRCLRAVKR